MNLIANRIGLSATKGRRTWMELIVDCSDLSSYSFLSLKEIALGSWLSRNFQFQV